MDEEEKDGTEELDPKQIKPLSLSEDDYAEAKNEGVSFAEHLESRELAAGYEPAGAAGNLDAFERQLAAHDLDPTSSARFVDNFFAADANSRYLFPEFVNRNIRLGMELGRTELRLTDLYAVSESITSGAAQKLGIDFAKENVKAKKTAQGTEFPAATLGAKNESVTLAKVGRTMNFTYEALRRMSLPMASIFLQRFGFILGRQVTQEGLKKMQDVAVASDAGGTWTYAKLVQFLLSPPQAHSEFTHVCLPRAFMIEILTDDTNFPQMQSRGLLEQFLATGEVGDFFGVSWRTHDAMDASSMTAWNRETGLVLYEEAGGYMVETDRMIRKQIEGTVVSYNFAFDSQYEKSIGHKTLS